MAGEAEGSVESCEHGWFGPELLGVSVTRGGVRDLYVVFALPNPVVRDAPSLGAQPHLCTSQFFGLQV